MSNNFLSFIYLAFLIYLFIGISIISDIFMEAIEVITSTTLRKEVFDKDNNSYFIEIPVWNATLANLSLMALGSSAPEILLNCILTVGDPGAKASELGSYTIVGSAAFNLLFITAFCIPNSKQVK